MDDFNNINNNNENNGFDSVENVKSDSGYTVTPDGGFYTKQKEDIIQDEVVTPAPEPQKTSYSQPQYSAPKNNYYPNGSYGQYAYPPYKKPKKVKMPKRKRQYGGRFASS